MKLYEINSELISLLDRLEPDPETGEVPADYEEIIAEINALALRREEILQYLAKLVMNLRSEAAAIKEEEARLKKRREGFESREERVMRVLDRECDGQTTDLGIATLSYRRTSRVDVSDEASAVAWLKEHNHTSALKIPEPTVYKAEVKKLISAGQEIPGCAVVEDRSCSLK
jgi:hypothetical protein